MDYNGYRIKSGEGGKYRWRYPTSDSLNNADAAELPVVAFITLKEFGEATGFKVMVLKLILI